MVVVSRSSIRDTWQSPSRRRPQNVGVFFAWALAVDSRSDPDAFPATCGL